MLTLLPIYQSSAAERWSLGRLSPPADLVMLFYLQVASHPNLAQCANDVAGCANDLPPFALYSNIINLYNLRLISYQRRLYLARGTENVS